ncbi:ATP-binding protein [Nonomuraea pusilla]|uniref:ATP-binding protein n=1 Tax=Nonomuraea pusilla TaxID=46177 RepID=UPI003331D27A
MGTEAALAGFKVKYTLAAKLVNELVEAADEKVLTKTIARYGRVDLLCIDELGYMDLDRHRAELLFQVLTEREETNRVAIASNESFSGWTKTFTEPRLCAAIVDRLTYGGNIVETGTESYRLAQTPGRRCRREQGRRLPLLSALPRQRLARRWEERVKMERPQAKPRTNDLDLERAAAITTASRKSTTMIERFLSCFLELQDEDGFDELTCEKRAAA